MSTESDNTKLSWQRLVPAGDANSPHIELSDSRILVSGRFALILIEEDHVVDSGMWYEIQNARWNGEKQELRVTWVDPSRAPLILKSSDSSMRPFMEDLSEKVNRTQVVVRNVTAPSGTVITGQIRRREDGELFSVISANGPLDDEGIAVAHSFERQLRESVGLE